MIWKLSLSGIKARLKDYLVLFSGLIISTSIFYMFLSMAMNPSFLKGDLAIAYSISNLVFTFGAFLLAILTAVYLNFANSFLLSMRKKSYGTYMMLGAKSGKIGNLIFVETLITGMISTLIGLILGVVLSNFVGRMLIQTFAIKINHYTAWVESAAIWTLIFFVALFFLAATFNRIKITKTPLIKLLHEEQSPTIVQNKKWGQVVSVILGLAFLGIGYGILIRQVYSVNAVLISLITIVLGTFFLFKATFTALINYLRKHQNFLYQNLRAFTLGQLKFRIADYTRILSAISIFFALALGAITVGLRFDSLKDRVSSSAYYDATIVESTSKVKQEVKKLNIASQINYQYKKVKNTYYLDEASLQKHPLVYIMVGNEKTITKKLTNNAQNWASSTMAGLIATDNVKFVSQAKYQAIQAQEQTLSLIRVKNFESDYLTLAKIMNLQGQDMPNLRATIYPAILGLISGFEFMGFFLGIAFLAMMASTLMFKVLTGAQKDQRRYQMLYKLGYPKKQIKKAITNEVGILFLLPGLVGTCHVLVGLNLFNKLVSNPYHNFWIPFSIFFVLYAIYFLITVKLYQKLALKKFQ